MFDQLSDKILTSIKRLKGQLRVTETNIEETLREIRMSLLEADVNFKVVKDFTERVKIKALGQEVLKSISPGQQFVKIVHEELLEVLGREAVPLNTKGSPAVILMVGLQGTGKTTSSAKLALYVRQKLGKRPGLVPADIQRPAAIEQLKTLAKGSDLPCFDTQAGDVPEELVAKALKWARDQVIDVLIVDTAGRLQVDDELMNELERVKKAAPPSEVLLVADAMLGQQSVQVAEGFNKKVPLTGLVLTKFDGDARGGAALSIRQTTGIPIKFLGVGEKISAFEVFHPDRLASRILDMGDVLGLVEKAQEVVSEEEALKAARKIAKNKFTVSDFLQQIRMMKKLGGLESLLGMMPGMGQMMKNVKNMVPPEKEIKKIEAIISSMTLDERENHKVLNGSRRLRIARGSGTQVSDVNKFIKQFEEAQKMMSRMMKMGGLFGGGKSPFGS